MACGRVVRLKSRSSSRMVGWRRAASRRQGRSPSSWRWFRKAVSTDWSPASLAQGEHHRGVVNVARLAKSSADFRRSSQVSRVAPLGIRPTATHRRCATRRIRLACWEWAFNSWRTDIVDQQALAAITTERTTQSSFFRTRALDHRTQIAPSRHRPLAMVSALSDQRRPAVSCLWASISDTFRRAATTWTRSSRAQGRRPSHRAPTIRTRHQPKTAKALGSRSAVALQRATAWIRVPVRQQWGY